MDQTQRNQWVNEVVGEVFSAMAADEVIREALIFKGARVLNMYLGDDRQSLDVDSNFTAEFAQGHPDLELRRLWAEENLKRAVQNYFENQNPVRFRLDTIKVKRDPNSDPHPRGWDGLRASISIKIDKNRVYKRTKAGKYGQKIATPDEYMERLALMNAIYPALDNRFEDCLKNAKGEYSILTSMRNFPGPHQAGEDVEKFLKGEGFEALDDGSGTMDFIHRDFGLILRDCHAQNWVVDRGMMVPIDIIPELVRCSGDGI